MNPIRRTIVEQAFNKMDYDRTGLISLDDLAAAFDSSQDTYVLSGRKTHVHTRITRVFFLQIISIHFNY